MAEVNLGDIFWRLGLKSTIDRDVGAAESKMGKLDKTSKKGKESLKSMGRSMTAVGGVAAGLGGSIVLLTDKAKKQNAALGVTAMQLGVSEEAMRSLALETTNVTFPLSEVTSTFDLLTRAGMTNTEEIQKTATAFDTLGDATGKTASVVTSTMITASKTFQVGLDEVAGSSDNLTYLLRNSTVEMENFDSVISYLTPDVVAMGTGMDETIAMMGIMEGKGMSGAVATREFRKGITEATAEGIPLNEALGITNEEMEEYLEKMSASSGITQEFADKANEQYGAVDNLKQAWDEWTLSVGSALEPLDTVGVGLTTFGGIMTGVGPAITLLSGIQMGTLVPSLMATAAAGWAAIAPWLPLVLAIGAVIAIGYLLYDNWDAIVASLTDLWGTILSFVEELWPKVTGVVSDAIDFLIMLFMNFTPQGIFISHFDEILSFLTGLGGAFYDAGAGIVQFLIDGITSLINKPAELVEGALGFIGDLLPHSPAKRGPLSKMPNWDAYLVEPLSSVKPAMEKAASDSVSTVASMTENIGGPRSETYDNSMRIDQMNFKNETDVDAFWRNRDERIRQQRIKRGLRT